MMRTKADVHHSKFIWSRPGFAPFALTVPNALLVQATEVME